MERHTCGEWLFFSYLADNMNGRLFKDLVTNMAEQIRDGPFKRSISPKSLSRSSSKEEILSESSKEGNLLDS